MTDAAGLIAWEQSWAGDARDQVASPRPRVFMPGLLADDSVVFVSIRGEDGLVGGGILNRAADAVGLSNLFGSRMELVWQDLIALAGDIFPGLPLVGYEHGDDLAVARQAGFESIGSLRIWRRRPWKL